jgi:hypothetical protein
MTDPMASPDWEHWKHRRGRRVHGAAPGGFVYFLGFIGALVYFLQAATGFWMGVLGVLKALVWPAVLVYEVLRHIHP